MASYIYRYPGGLPAREQSPITGPTVD